jgi:hypothetical protein
VTGYDEAQARASVRDALAPRPPRRTRCQVAADQEAAMASWPDDMPYEAASFEAAGWAMAFDLAPRCDDLGCCTCHG